MYSVTQLLISVHLDRAVHVAECQCTDTLFTCYLAQMVAMVHCECFVCKDCFSTHYTMMAREKGIFQLNCLICAQPDLANTDIDQDDYLMLFAGLLKEHVYFEYYQIFQKKTAEFALQKDPDFRWCAHVSIYSIHAQRPGANAQMLLRMHQITTYHSDAWLGQRADSPVAT